MDVVINNDFHDEPYEKTNKKNRTTENANPPRYQMDVLDSG